MTIRISKYLIFFVIIGSIIGYLIFPIIRNAITFKKTKGTIQSFTSRVYQGRRGPRLVYFPIVEYEVNNDTFLCYGSSSEYVGHMLNDTLPVIYEAGNPGNAYVDTFLGSWSIVFLIIPASVFLFLLVSVDAVPDYLVIKI
jgi:hypothetical protein